MDEMKSSNASLVSEGEPRFPASRFVKVFMHGERCGRKINLAIHNSYDSLSFTLKRLGNNYSISPFQLNGLTSIEEDGAMDDNDFILLYDNLDGDRFFLGEIPWELFTVSVKKIYIIPAEKEDDNENNIEEEDEDNNGAGDDAADGDDAATSGAGEGDEDEDGVVVEDRIAATDDGADEE